MGSVLGDWPRTETFSSMWTLTQGLIWTNLAADNTVDPNDPSGEPRSSVSVILSLDAIHRHQQVPNRLIAYFGKLSAYEWCSHTVRYLREKWPEFQTWFSCEHTIFDGELAVRCWSHLVTVRVLHEPRNATEPKFVSIQKIVSRVENGAANRTVSDQGAVLPTWQRHFSHWCHAVLAQLVALLGLGKKRLLTNDTLVSLMFLNMSATQH